MYYVRQRKRETGAGNLENFSSLAIIVSEMCNMTNEVGKHHYFFQFHLLILTSFYGVVEEKWVLIFTGGQRWGVNVLDVSRCGGITKKHFYEFIYIYIFFFWLPTWRK